MNQVTVAALHLEQDHRGSGFRPTAFGGPCRELIGAGGPGTCHSCLSRLGVGGESTPALGPPAQSGAPVGTYAAHLGACVCLFVTAVTLQWKASVFPWALEQMHCCLWGPWRWARGHSDGSSGARCSLCNVASGDTRLEWC